LPQQRLIAARGDLAGVAIVDMDVSSRSQHGRGPHAVADDLVEIEFAWFERPRVQVRQCEHEHVVHDPRQPPHLGGDHVQRIAVLRLGASCRGERDLRGCARD
jgi:hypothetical protein